MERKQAGLPQEALKLIACITMLIDHMGASLFPRALWLRVIGRVAFPIYCFLLAEGVARTRHPLQYGLRLAVGALLSEYPFDYLFYGHWYWGYQSVMVTLLLAYLMGQGMRRLKPLWAKVLLIVPFALAAEFCRSDYGALGIAFAALFFLTRQTPGRPAIQFAGLCIFSILYDQGPSVELFCVFGMLPIALYSGRKATYSRALQWGFYLFYPVHLAVLALICRVLR